MLVLPLKGAVKWDVQGTLAKWLDGDQQVSFEPKNPLQLVVPKPDFRSDACRQELLRLVSLRNCVCEAVTKANSHAAAMEENGLEDCYEFHAALLEFEKRGFPTVEDDGNGLRLTWKGAFAPQKETHSNLIWDRAVTMFNTVALLSYKAAQCSVTDRSDCKNRVALCQEAAGILSVLKELAPSQDYATVDLSQPMLTLWERLLLAEAQTAIYRMAALAEANATKHGTLSYLAQSSFKLLNEALEATQDRRLQSEVPRQVKDWGSYVKAAAMLNSAKAEYHQAAAHRLASQWGMEIARLRECRTKLESCRDFCKTVENGGADNSVVSYTYRDCTAILPVVADRLAEAVKDNHAIYQDYDIPSTLPEIQAKQLAKNTSSLPQGMLIPRKTLFVNL